MGWNAVAPGIGGEQSSTKVGKIRYVKEGGLAVAVAAKSLPPSWTWSHVADLR